MKLEFFMFVYVTPIIIYNIKNICDSDMAYCLNLSKEEYIEILKLYNAKKDINEYFFS